jgi:hypothetical protein
VKLFLDLGEEFQDNLVPGRDYPDVDGYQALESFDPESLGWVPLWFPRYRDGKRLEDRLARAGPTAKLSVKVEIKYRGLSLGHMVHRESWEYVGPHFELRHSQTEESTA